MDKVHNKNIIFLKRFLKKRKFDWLNYNLKIEINYFSSGGGTHLYLIKNGNKKFLVRINFFIGKNDWKVKRNEFKILNKIKYLNISPKPYLINEDNPLKQDFTIVEYIEGKNILSFSEPDIIFIARDLKKLHELFKHKRMNKSNYTCSIYNEFSEGEDKKIENYNFKYIKKVFFRYNLIKENLGEWFNHLSIFNKCKDLCLCHGDLKKENILRTKKGIMLIDWECAGVDIPETDIARLFSGCKFTKKQQDRFLREYYNSATSKETLNRILAIRTVLDFFRIIEDYCILKRKKFNVENMLSDLNKYQKSLDVLKKIL